MRALRFLEDEAPYAGKVAVDHFSEVPAYLQLAGILRDMINSGEIRPQTPVPSICTLTQTYDVAKGTVEKALGVLREEGLVRTVPGRGVYVVKR